MARALYLVVPWIVALATAGPAHGQG